MTKLATSTLHATAKCGFKLLTYHYVGAGGKIPDNILNYIDDPTRKCK